jgi:ADP-ribose pyrophosphatase YjhB (NUDIX family)
MNEPAVIPTIGIVVVDNGQVLLIAKKNHPRGDYQLPGGQIETGESDVQAACRELLETTGLKADPKDMTKIPQVWRATIEKTYGTKVFVFNCFVCHRYIGTVTETKDAISKWFTPTALENTRLVPNTLNAIQASKAL